MALDHDSVLLALNDGHCVILVADYFGHKTAEGVIKQSLPNFVAMLNTLDAAVVASISSKIADVFDIEADAVPAKLWELLQRVLSWQGAPVCNVGARKSLLTLTLQKP